MKKIILTLTISLFTIIGFSQISGKISGSSSKIKKMQTKILAVEILEEDLSLLDKFKSSKKKAKAKKRYLSLVESYNNEIKASVTKLWKLNEKIEFKSSSEIDAIIKSNDSKYVLLTYYQQRSMADKPHDYSKRINLRKIPMPVINYVSPGTEQKTPECYSNLPVRYDIKSKTHRPYIAKDIDFTLTLLQKHINQIIKTDKALEPFKFLKDEAKKNCGRLASKTFLLNKKEMIGGFDMEKAKKSYKNKFKRVDAEIIEAAVKNKESDKAYSVVLPSGYSQLSLVCYKLAVDAETGDILGLGNAMYGGKDASISFTPADLKIMSKCK
jgi:hypothetical protein